jgi:O-antigen/teichoic acid export membrane protein
MKIFKNYLYNTAYQLFALIIPLITTPYISRVLGSEGVGTFAYTNSVIQYFVLIGSVGISMYGNRVIAYERDNRKKMSESFWSLVIIRFVFVIFAYGLFIVFLLFRERFREEYLVQSIQIIAVAFDISWLFMGLEDFKTTVIRNFFVKLISTISIFIFVKDEHDIVGYILILGLSTLLGNLTLWTYLKSVIDKFEFRNLQFYRHIKGSFILFIPQISMQFYLVLNKTMLGAMVGVKSAGYYENTDKIVKVSLTVITAVVTVMMPRMANTFAKRDFTKLNNYLTTTIDFVTFGGVLLTSGLAALAPTFSSWFMGQEFSYTGVLIPVLALVCLPIAWSSVLGGQYLVMIGKEKMFTISVTCGAVINVLANWLLIPAKGAMGSVLATVIAETAITMIDLFYVGKVVSLKKLFSAKWQYLLAGFVSFGLARLLNSMMVGNFVTLSIQAFSCVALYLLICTVLRAPMCNLIISYVHSNREGRH